MILPHRVTRRILAAAGSAVIGLIGAIAISSPASAHHSEVSGSPYCDTEAGEWVVEWEVKSVAPRGVEFFELIDVQVQPSNTTVNGIEVTEQPARPYRVGQTLTGEQRLPGDATKAKLGVRAKWDNNYTESRIRWGQVSFGGPCKTEQPGPKPVQIDDASDCDKLFVTVSNPKKGERRHVQVKPNEGETRQFKLHPGKSKTVHFPGHNGLKYKVIVEGDRVGKGEWKEPRDCKPAAEVPIAALSDCESLTVEVSNPLARPDHPSIQATITSGEVTEELTIAPGETGHATFDAAEGTTATVTIGEESWEVDWQKPEDCDQPGDGTGGGDEELPVTGLQGGLAITGALLLLTLGAGLFMVARKRRITFTA